MNSLRYGFVGGGFVTAFHLRAIAQVRGIEVAGLVSRTPPEKVAAWARERGLGEAKIYASVKEMAPHVDVIAVFSPNFTRVAVLEEIAEAVKAGAELKGLIAEKPLARNLAEANRIIELADRTKLPTAYFENQVHMKTVQAMRAQLAATARTMGPPVLTRSGEEHAGPHNAWFWDPVQQGGGVMSDMGCHCLSVGWYALTPQDKPPTFLQPVSVSADLSLLKWGQPRWRQELLDRHGVDYGQTPAEDFATGMLTLKNPDDGQITKSQFSASWMFEKQGLRIALEGIGPGYAFDINTLQSPLSVFVGDAAAAAVTDAETALEKSTASRGLLAVQPNEPDLYGYTDENVEALTAFQAGRSALLDWRYGREIVRLTMAAYRSAEEGKVVDLTDEKTRAELEDYVPLIQQGRGKEVL